MRGGSQSGGKSFLALATGMPPVKCGVCEA